MPREEDGIHFVSSFNSQAMRKEKENPIHPYSDYFTAKSDASAWFSSKHHHECGTVIAEKKEVPGGLYISFRSAQDWLFPERFNVLITK